MQDNPPPIPPEQLERIVHHAVLSALSREGGLERLITAGVREAIQTPDEIARLAEVEDQLLTFKDMMRLGNMGKNKLRDAIKKRTIPAFLLGGKWQITRRAWRAAIGKLQGGR